ncbi:glucosamine-6-phosphate deaminase [Salibacterium aidingense]|uniref:glucosamine-6-phosphate deaminase n=1 Tax=Salibacterium aidingense TaxID=384933 RepID=UPI00041BA71C|nr:glucosamine-6-phosphate deaminase [Salibacterium aidingense]
MKIKMVNNYQEMSNDAADLIEDQLKKKKASILGLATGGTPEGLYEELVRRYHLGRIDFQEVQTFNLDEYIGLPQDHPQSYAFYMWSRFFSQVNIDPARIHLPFSTTAGDAEAATAYDKQLKQAGGIDLQLLGIGENGHIGFNEPSSFLWADTHYAELSRETMEANARFFAWREDVPQQAITMGMAPILQARHIVLMASGKEKAHAVKEMLCSPISPWHPASFLQLHSNVEVVLDAEAAAELPPHVFAYK